MATTRMARTKMARTKMTRRGQQDATLDSKDKTRDNDDKDDLIDGKRQHCAGR